MFFSVWDERVGGVRIEKSQYFEIAQYNPSLIYITFLSEKIILSPAPWSLNSFSKDAIFAFIEQTVGAVTSCRLLAI